MATVYLPLSSFSRKILLTEYGGEEPVVPGRADWLSDQLRTDRSDTKFSDRVLALMATGIRLEVPAAIADHIATQGHRLGVVIHRNHIEQLTRHMLSAVILGSEAKRAMRAFYDLYDLDDDDLDEQSVYREYGRFSKKFFEKIDAKAATKSAGVVRRDSRIWQGANAQAPRVTNATLESVCAALDERLRELRIRRLKRLTKQAHVYLWYMCGRRRVEKVARTFGIHRSGVYRAIKSVRRRIRSDKAFAGAILPLTDPAFVLPAGAAQPNLCATPPAAAPA